MTAGVNACDYEDAHTEEEPACSVCGGSGWADVKVGDTVIDVQCPEGCPDLGAA